jgi:hypothetical protein
MLFLFILLFSLQVQASLGSRASCVHPFDIEMIHLADGSHGNKIFIVTEQGVPTKVRKQYAKPELLTNDVIGLVLLNNAILASQPSLTNVSTVKILGHVKPDTMDIEFARGAVVENIAERQSLAAMTPYQQNAMLRLRDRTDQVDLRKPPTEFEQWFLDRPYVVERMKDTYNQMLEKLTMAVEAQASRQNIKIINLELIKHDGNYLSLYVAYKLPNSEITRYIFIKPDNLVVTKDLNFIIFDPY